VPFGGQLQRRRAAVASWAALAVAVGGVVTYAVQADGYQSHQAELNDGGIWVTSKKDGSYGRINKPIGELDGTVFSRIDSNLDVVQDGSSVVGVDLTDGVVLPLDPAQMKAADDQEAAIPGSPAVGMAGGSLAVLDSVTGKLWATREDPAAGIPAVGSLANQTDPVATVGKDAALAVALDGTVFAASATSDELLTLHQSGDIDFGTPTTERLPGDPFSDAIALTAVGAVPVVLDSASGRLVVMGGAEAEVPKGSVLQQPGPSASSVLVGARDGLLAVDLASGHISTVTPVAGNGNQGVGGEPANPVRLGDCVYGAWAGGTGAVVTACGSSSGEIEGVPQALDAQTSDLVFRVNRGQIVLNDRASGHVWDVDSDEPTQLDNWDAFHLKSQDKNDDDDENKQDQGDRRPPKAKDDDLGARPGRTTILHPLDNDTAPSGRLLAIRSVRQVGGATGQLAISPDGQTVQITLPGDAVGGTSFEYFIDDGRQSVSAHATVRVGITAAGAQNSEPELRNGFEPRVWTVPASGTIDVPVLSDWRDPADGDPVSTVSAQPESGSGTGADARVTGAGAVRFHAPAQGGLVKVDYDVTDGLGAPVAESLAFRVQDPNDLDGVAPTAEPDVISGETGEPVVISPLANDLPGADPANPDAVLALAGKVAQVPGAEVTTNLVKGTVTLRSTTAQTYFLDYQAAYGTAETATGKIRVDVRAPENPPLPPVAVPDTVTLFGQAGSLVDVLANDVDPGGGLLSVQRAEAVNANQLDVAVVAGRWLRVSARQGALTPNPQLIRYTISNGRTSGITGQVVVSQRPLPEDNTPVTQNDEVTVRAGTSQSIPVLDNDFSPSGGTLSLVTEGLADQPGSLDVQPIGAPQGDLGSAYVTGRAVRYVAPDVAGTKRVTIRYQAANEQGDTATGKVRVTVLPLRVRDNQPPEPPVLEGRTVSGDSVKLRLPGYGVDPDGDAVTLLGLDSAPALGRVTRIGANSIEYAAYPGQVGTDEFTYTLTDTFGATSTGTARVSETPPGPPQPPLAVPDQITVAPGRTAVVDVLANDLVAAGSRVSVSLVDPPPGVRLRSGTGPMELQAPSTVDGRSLQVVYRINDGLDSSQSTVTLRTAKGYNNPPVVSDAFGAVGDGASITADVLSAGSVVDGATTGSTSGAYDPDGPFDDLRVAQVYAPAGIATSVNGGEITIERAEQPMVVPFRVEDADGGAATGSLYVPAASSGMPFVKQGAGIEVDPGKKVDADLSDYVVDPAGGPVSFTLKSRIWASPRSSVQAEVTGNDTFRVSAGKRYAGPGAVVFEVTTGRSVDDPDGIKATLSVPVQVGETRPILRCPEDPLEVPQGGSVRIDTAAVCHVITAEQDQVDGLTRYADLDQVSAAGLTAGTPDANGVVQVTASGASSPGDTGTLRVAADNSAPGRINIRVIPTPPPSLAPIRVSTLRAGESQTIDLAQYLTPGVQDPVPTVVSADQLTGLDVRISHQGSSVTITTGAKVHGHAEFRVVMSDVAGDSAPGRRVQGRISLDVLGPPSVPGTPVPGKEVLDSRVSLDWRPAESNGSPIDFYEVADQFGHATRCRGASCTILGLQNGTTYRFRVRAHNAVGFSDWSGTSVGAMPDDPIDLVGRIKLVDAGDGLLHISWQPVKTKGGAEISYRVKWAGGQDTAYVSNYTATGLDNHLRYTFTITPLNGFIPGGALTSAPFQPIGPPGQPRAPTITDQESPGSQGAVSLSWDPVDPNGPGPVRYTVYRDGSALATCTKIQTTGCDNANIDYEGQTYSYTVQAINKDGKSGGVLSAMGPAAQWKAVGKPAAWGSWDVEATGNNNQAHATFTVPATRGSESRVYVYADGAKVQSLAAIGSAEATFDVPNNLGPHTVMLEVCNEKGACSQSSTQNVQTYGPLVQGNIHSITPNIDVTKISWTIEVDSNGDPATLTVTSDRGRAEQFAVPVGVSSFTTQPIDLGYKQTENVTVTLADGSPARGPVSATNAAVTDPPPPPVIVVSRGALCSDDSSTGKQPCRTLGTDGDPNNCIDVSCGFVHISLANWDAGQPVYCIVNDHQPGQGVSPNTDFDSRFYFGVPGGNVHVYCEQPGGAGVATADFTWPTT
jgi:hypothetical protein